MLHVSQKILILCFHNATMKHDVKTQYDNCRNQNQHIKKKTSQVKS